MKDCYEILGLSKDATEEELKNRYEQLRAKYKEDRFLPGEEGNEAAKKLNELEDAWLEISRDVENRRYSDDYDRIEALIKEKKYDDAQSALDAVTERNAKWHYYQSQVYYYREWLTESRKQLTLAIEGDPDNAKYKTALEKLDAVMGNGKADPKKVNNSDASGDDIDKARENADRARYEEANATGNALSNCCAAYCITSMCCDAMSCCCR